MIGIAIPGSRIPGSRDPGRFSQSRIPGLSASQSRDIGIENYLLNCMLNNNFRHKKNLFANNDNYYYYYYKKMTPVAVRSPGPYCTYYVTLTYV